jgi:uncharacterized membrane protein
MTRHEFIADRRGGVSILAAGGFSVLIGFSALAVDLGSVFLQTRRLQGAADLAAMAAARDLDNAHAAATATAQAADWRTPLTVSVTKGRYVPEPNLQPDARFQVGQPEPDAARVRLTGQADLFFGHILTGTPSWTIARQATATRADLASFSIGTRLAALNGGIANALLSGLTGSQVSLSVMDYNALVDADVELFSYLDAVATELDLEAATYDEILASSLTTGQALSALSTLLAAQNKVQASAAVRAVATEAGSKNKVDLQALFDVGPYGRQAHIAGGRGASVELVAMDLTSAMLQLSDGERQVQLDLGATLPGLADVNAWLAIGEPANSAPWLAITRSKDVIVRTAQARIYIEAKVGGSGLLAPASIKIPIYLETASGEARLNAFDCNDRTATLDVRPSLGSLAIGQIDTATLDNFKAPVSVSTATIAKAPLFSVTGKSEVKLGGTTWKPVKFTSAEVQARTVKTVSTTDIAQASLGSLISGLSLDVNLLGLPLGLGESAITLALGSVLGAAASPLDDLINSLTGLLGVQLGQADVRMNGLRCRDAALVA